MKFEPSDALKSKRRFLCFYPMESFGSDHPMNPQSEALSHPTISFGRGNRSLIHKRSSLINKMSSLIHKKSSFIHKISSLIHKMSLLSDWKSSLIHKKSSFINKMSSFIHKMSLLNDWKSSFIHKKRTLIHKTSSFNASIRSVIHKAMIASKNGKPDNINPTYATFSYSALPCSLRVWRHKRSLVGGF